MNQTLFYRILSVFLAISLSTTILAGASPTRTTRASSSDFNSNHGVSLLTGPNPGDALTIALAYLQNNRALLGLGSADLQDVIVTDRYTSKHTGVTHLYLRQRYQAIEIFQANLNFNITRDGAIISQGGSFIANLAQAANPPLPARTASQSIATAASHLGLKLAAPPRLLSASDQPDQASIYSVASLAAQPVRARLVYHVADPQALRLAWSLEIYEHSQEHYWQLLLDAQDGQVLAKYDYVIHDDWGIPPVAFDDFDTAAASPLISLAQTDAGAASLASTSAQNPNAPTVAARYRVFALPKENPSDGLRSLETPEDAITSPFGWHDTNGAPGAEYTITRGNNAYAYTDLNYDNIADPGSSPDGGAGLLFDLPLDLSLGPETYRPFAVTNLFYWTNILHDVLYRYGFDEQAGNFQVNNYGKGGLASDSVQAEAQDGSGTNNANFLTLVDGAAPRMQMYVWQPPAIVTLTVNSPAGIAGNYLVTGALFGPAVVDLTGNTIEALDATPPTTDGCETITTDLTGKIALIDRGLCNFTVKVKNAQNKGAIGAIIINSLPGDPITMGGTDATITIPSVMVNMTDGALFRANLPNVRIQRAASTSPNRDSDLDAGVIAHEYAHGLSIRLTGGPSNVSCLYNQEQMGEGWSDFNALVLTTDPADTPTTRRGMGTYLVFQPTTGTGIRPNPYSTSLATNPSTYASISTQVVPHGVGYVWATMLWEVYWNLVALHGYNPDVYGAWNSGGNNLAVQLVIDGMKYQPCSPGFVDGRNAILQADQALTGGANYCAIYAAFAKRGLGYSASQGSSTSTTDGIEAFDMPPACAPDILTSSEITSFALPDQTASSMFTFQNLGSSLAWTISEAVSDCASPADLHWFSAGIVSGTTDPGHITQIPFTVNASGLVSGDARTGLLCIASNDPAEPLLSIPITLRATYPFYLPTILRP